MRQLYKKGSAEYPRLNTDTLFADHENRYCYHGFLDDTIRYVEEFQLLDPVHWKRFVEQFRTAADFDNGWRGEYWGKMMRGACFTYAYTQNAALYSVLRTTVIDMLESEDSAGRISSYSIAQELGGWDLWCRKYVLLGMQYFMEICPEEDLKARIVASMCRQADYLIERIGTGVKKIPITKTSAAWRGLNSSSILEPILRLYHITENKAYLDFAEHIIQCGGTSVENLFTLALENNLPPYRYPITKAYEMISFFEGILEYYHLTGIEAYKNAVVNFANRILESDFTVIGSSGCTHELFDHSSVRQANTTNGAVMQETCVTVTLMKFFYQMTLLTADTRYVDAFEISLYNAYLGSVNTEKKIGRLAVANTDTSAWIHEPLPFDSYSPLTAGTRGNSVGGLKRMADNHYYGCCACIASAGVGLIPKMQLLTSHTGFAFNLYINGTVSTLTPAGNPITFNTKTDYPVSGNISITLCTESEEAFEIKLRNPAWSRTTTLSVNGEIQTSDEGYITLSRTWKSGDSITLALDMRTEAIYPIPYGSDILMNKVIWDQNYVVPTYDKEDPLAKHHIALRRGPLMLAQENRLGYSVDNPIDVCVKNGYVDVHVTQEKKAPYPCVIEVTVPLSDGNEMLVTDYASAGKLWNEESKMAVWMLTK